MVLTWYFTANRGATKPQVMAVDVVSWAMMRVDWRRGTVQIPCTRIPRLQMAPVTKRKLTGMRHALKDHHPLSFIKLQAVRFSSTEDLEPLPLSWLTRQAGEPETREGDAFPALFLWLPLSLLPTGADQSESTRRGKQFCVEGKPT